mgnify:CR=1 FL=1
MVKGIPVERPTGADLRTKMQRPDEELNFLYTEEHKVSRSKTKVVECLLMVEEYILYLEKKLKSMEKKTWT